MGIELSARHSRRGLLTGVAGALAGAAAATLAGVHSVLAAGDDGKIIHVGDHDADVRSTTTLTNSSNDRTVISVHSDGFGTAIFGGSGSGNAIHGVSQSGKGVVGASAHDIGVHGAALSGYAVGVWGTAVHGNAIFGQSKSGSGVFAESESSSAIYCQTNSAADPALLSWAMGHGTAVQGYSGALGTNPPASLPDTGVLGSATGGPSAVGVHGSAAAGRGGLFSGGLAQLKLVPSSDATHPNSGQAGDLFLDKSHRLWLCKGGSTWAQLG
jgi:hypothetical protein